MSKNKTGRNEPCPCESGLKYKYCHGDKMKELSCKDVMNKHMADLIIAEKVRRGMIEMPEPEVESKIIMP